MIKVTCGILKKDGKYFAAKRPVYKKMGDYWEFPGGKVEDDEFESDCLHREWMEELGVSIIILKDFMPVTCEYPEFQIELYSFLVDILEGNIALKEHVDSGFFTKEELLGLKLTPADRIIVEKFL